MFSNASDGSLMMIMPVSLCSVSIPDLLRGPACRHVEMASAGGEFLYRYVALTSILSFSISDWHDQDGTEPAGSGSRLTTR
jgi:hypothetical protein